MMLQTAVNTILVQLSDSLVLLSSEQYVKPCSRLSNNSIGQHVRHVIEMFQCLEDGYEGGLVDYENRKRDKQIESEKLVAIQQLQGIYPRLNKPDKPLLLLTYYDDQVQDPEKIESNYHREIAYNLEHSIHHMALIRIGISELSNISLEDSYGVAFSTVKYRRECAQ
jgi:hypothetical protein